MLDAQIERRMREDVDAALDAEPFEDSVRAIARSLASSSDRDPAWLPVLVEFWTHASRREPLRSAVLERHERVLDVAAGVLEELGARQGRRFRLPPRELARGAAALWRGMVLERLLDPAAAGAEVFEQMFVAYVEGLAE